jgi:DNA-binding NarL/FixJ family response regulator
MRQGVVSLLSEDSSLKVIGEAANGRELLDLLKLKEPDVVLLDIEMPVMNGLQALEVMSKRFPKVKVIMLSMHLSPGMISEFMARGASAFLPKETNIEVLIEAINTVKIEGHYYNKNVSDAMRKSLQSNHKSQSTFHEQALTAREISILKLICDGKTNSDIAQELNISYNTVDFHRRNLYSKTQSSNIPGLVKYAIKHGILNLS